LRAELPRAAARRRAVPPGAAPVAELPAVAPWGGWRRWPLAWAAWRLPDAGAAAEALFELTAL